MSVVLTQMTSKRQEIQIPNFRFWSVDVQVAFWKGLTADKVPWRLTKNTSSEDGVYIEAVTDLFGAVTASVYARKNGPQSLTLVVGMYREGWCNFKTPNLDDLTWAMIAHLLRVCKGAISPFATVSRSVSTVVFKEEEKH